MANISKANLQDKTRQDKDIRKLQPPKSKKKIAVGNPKELYLWLNPSGKKAFFIRTKDDKSLTIGEFREGNSVSEARMDAVKLLKELESGKDIDTIKGKNDKYKFKSLFNIYIEQKQKNGAAIPQSDKIKISVSDDFKLLPGSTKKKPKYQAHNGWKEIEIEPCNLESTLKSYSAISTAVFQAGKRSNENIAKVNPLLIYDIDNSDNKKPQFTINDAVNTLNSKGIQGYIYPSASHLLDEKTQKFRLLIPTLNAFDYLKHKTTGYKIYMDNTTKFLGLKDKVDEVYKTPSQLYYAPKKDTELIIVPGQVLDNGKIIKQSEYDIELAKEKEIIKQKRV